MSSRFVGGGASFTKPIRTDHPIPVVELPVSVYQLSDFTITSGVTGSGSYGSVVSARHNTINAGTLILKKYTTPLFNTNYVDIDIIKEISILMICKHYSVQGVVKCYGIAVNGSGKHTEIYLVLEKLTQSLTNFVDLFTSKSKSKSIPNDQQIEIIRETFKKSLQALNNFNSIGFLHSDVKPDNLMITSDAEVRLIDFGLSCFVGYLPHLATTTGYNSTIVSPDTPLLMSPHYRRGNRVSYQSDSYALGKLFSDHRITNDGNILKDASGKQIPEEDFKSHDHYQLIFNMTKPETSERWSAIEALHAPFITSELFGGAFSHTYYGYSPQEIKKKSTELVYFDEIYNTYKNEPINLNHPLDISNNAYVSDMFDSGTEEKSIFGYDVLFNAIIAKRTLTTVGTFTNYLSIYNCIVFSKFSDNLSDINTTIIRIEKYLSILNEWKCQLPFISIWSVINYHTLGTDIDPFMVADAIVWYLCDVDIEFGQFDTDDLVKFIINTKVGAPRLPVSHPEKFNQIIVQ